MANEGGVDMLIDLLESMNEHVQRQAAKALANLGVNGNILCFLVFLNDLT
jgi:HEAT repeat protein